MCELSSLDLDLYADMLDFGVFVDAKRDQTPRRAVFVGCPDCDKLKDTFRHHGTSIGQKLHPACAIHGGGAAFHRNSPLNGPVAFKISSITSATTPGL